MSKYKINPNIALAGVLVATGAGLHAYGTSEANYVENRVGEHAEVEGAPLSDDLAEHERRSDLADGIGNIALGLGLATIIFDPFERIASTAKSNE